MTRSAESAGSAGSTRLGRLGTVKGRTQDSLTAATTDTAVTGPLKTRHSGAAIT